MLPEPFDDILRQGQVGKFKRMADAIANLSESTGEKPIIYSLCQWGRVRLFIIPDSICQLTLVQEQPWYWARDFGQSWRVRIFFASLNHELTSLKTTDDIGPEWWILASIINA